MISKAMNALKCIVCNGHILQWDLTFTELRQKVGMYIQMSVILMDVSGLDGNHKLFVTKKRKKKRSAKLCQFDYR